MNPFILAAMAITAIFGSLQPTFITSFTTLRLLLEPTPPPGILTLPTVTIGLHNTSFPPVYSVFPSCSWTDLMILDPPATVFPEDLRHVTGPVSNKGSNDPPMGELEEDYQVSYS